MSEIRIEVAGVTITITPTRPDQPDDDRPPDTAPQPMQVWTPEHVGFAQLPTEDQ